MTRLPLFASLPHAGLDVPEELAPYHQLTPEQIAEDGDVGARQIYSRLRDEVVDFVTTSIARAFVDINRATDDLRKDGIVKTHTCWDVPIWRETPPQEAFDAVIVRHHAPYHRRLSQPPEGAIVGVDLHTMAAAGPPVGPDPGVTRPAACIGIGEGTCPEVWADALRVRLEEALGHEVTINRPFRGGYIIRSHARELPWLMLELSRGDFMTDDEKGDAVQAAMRSWAQWLSSSADAR